MLQRDMISTRKDLRFYLSEDRKRNNIPNGFFQYRIRLFARQENALAFRYIKCLRRYEYYLNNSSKLLLYRFLSVYYHFRLLRLGAKYSIQIRPNTCGFGLRILHLSGGGGVILNVEKVGNYCGFNSGVILGNKDGENNRPIIGDQTSFGPGAKAFGNITIGNNCFIASNSVVTKSFPDDCIIAGVPGRIIKKREDRKEV